MTTDRIEQATRLLVDRLGRGRHYVSGKLELIVRGYTDEEADQALRRWRVWKRGMRALERRDRTATTAAPGSQA